MPLGLRFLPTPKKVKKVVSAEKVKSDGIELKSLSDPLLNISCDGVAAGFICKSESVHILPNSACRAAGIAENTVFDFSDLNFEVTHNSLAEGHSIDDQPVHDHDSAQEAENDKIADEQEVNALDICEMIGSFFDRNGNPVDDDEESAIVIGEPSESNVPASIAAAFPEPKCFINAAELLDEEPEYVPSPPPSLLFRTESSATAGSTSPKPPSGIPVRRRVPISKSFPDIIQTTILPRRDNDHGDEGFGFKTAGTSRNQQSGHEPMQNSMIVADSLEEIQAIQPTASAIPAHRDSIDVPDGSVRVFERIEPIMTESVVGGGIMNEKPPETWIVDFNSFTSEVDDEQRLRERRKSTSSTNSMAYFLSMDEVDCPAEAPQRQNADEALTSSSDSSNSKKMIFSMFVDLGGGKEIQSSKGKPEPVQQPISRTAKADSANLRLRALHSGIPRYPHPHFPLGVKGQDFRLGGGSTSMSSSMMMSSVSDVERSQVFHGISNRSSLHVANHEHDGSFSSSILSSMEMSAVEDSDVCQGGPCFKLGMDLLRMFQEGINTDVAISVRGRFVKAHKCILASRSQYFAAILSGNWIQKAGNTIHLDEFSYNTVQFTMYHIYSGTNEIPDTIDLMELATLTDMLGLEGLREVISQTIRNRFCHNFHRPCTGCIAGILEFFPLAVSYGMEDLQRKMTKWICKHFVRIWPTKAFANMGAPLIEKCLGFSVSHLSPENLLDVTLGCDQLQSTMPSVRWTEAIFVTVNKLTEACVHYVGEHLSEVLQSQRFLLFGKGQTWNISRIENTFLEGILLLKADEACLSHVALCRLIELGTVTIDEVEWSTMFVVFLKMLRSEVEKFLLANASKAVLSKNWEQLSQDVRKRICATSFHGADKGANKKGGPMKNMAASPNTPIPAPRTARQSPSSATPPPQTATRARISPQQAKVAGTMSTPRKSPSPCSDFQIPPPMPISESAQKSTSTKSVASVKPMQSQPQTPVAPSASTPKMPNVYSSSRDVPSGSATWTRAGRGTASGRGAVAAENNKNAKPAPAQRSAAQAEPLHRRKTASVLEKERSFDTSSSRVSSAGSGGPAANRNGAVARTAKPLTPSPRTPNPPIPKPIPLTTTHRRAISVPEPPPPQPKTPFLTNSEKAKAVSKPKLIFRSQRSNSVSTEPPPSPLPSELKTHSRQGSVGCVRSTRPQPNVVQPSRYANVKPKTNSEKTIKPPSSPLPRSRFGHTPAAVEPIEQPRSIDPRSSGPGHGTGTYRISRGRTGNVHGKNEVKVKRSSDMDRSWQMSRSSIETESDASEPKMRTLAEIGRSSTFSKDEPTVLGKMEVSVDYDDN